MEQKKNYTLPIIMMFLLFAMISFVTGLSNPLGVIVKNQFAVANWMSQLGNFANFIAYAVMGIPAGMMLKRIGYKKTALAPWQSVSSAWVSSIFRAKRAVPDLPDRRIRLGLLDVYAQHRRQPDAQYARRGGKKGNQLIQFAVRSTRFPRPSFRCWWVT